MKYIALIFAAVIFNSCFLFSDLRKTRLSFSENGYAQSVLAVIPKKFERAEMEIDSVGNQVHYYFYRGGEVLYFALLKDTSTQLQPINYELNIPKQVYKAVYFKGIDSSNRYWRETRFQNYRAGYKNVKEDNEGAFDSSLNYFSLHMPH
ncbi:MAG TPA: hypothetical protein VNT20_06460 [Flavisolibacter sp.]|jgi:hypothetical protein|nr:hypothetical protein [Flavisolibacter sp.]